jgi:uncharacterized membrane protein YsdA (DUF1294 family)/cold shock CspA family protein
MRVQGKIASWNSDKGFGFIAPSSGDQQIFVHIRSLPNRSLHPEVGLEVSYEIASDAQGRTRAENVRVGRGLFLIGPASKAFLTAAVFLLAVYAGAVLRLLPMLLVWWYLSLSVISLAIYALDKSAARKGGQRTPESTLHFLSLAGGWPGALYAQQLLRHKSIKRSFVGAFWVTVVLNVVALAYVASPYGAWFALALERMAA